MDQNILDMDLTGQEDQQHLPDPFDLISLEPQGSPSPPQLSYAGGYTSPDKIQRFEEFIEDKPMTQPVSDYRFWQVEYYRDYFDISTATVLLRLKKALIPMHSDSFFGDQQPDLYTPFWIATTLIFVLTVAGNLGSFFAQETDVTDIWSTEASKIVAAVGIVYGLMIVIPLIIYCALTNVGSQITLVEMVSLYGYSYLIFIPVGLI